MNPSNKNIFQFKVIELAMAVTNKEDQTQSLVVILVKSLCSLY